MRIFTFLLLVLLLHTGVASAQRGYFEPAFIIQNSDTIAGFIQRNAETALGKGINFKARQDSEEISEYTPHDITGFSFSADKIWFEAVEAEILKDTGFVKTTRFAKVLLKGQASLYILQLLHTEYKSMLLKGNSYVYVLRKEEAFYTLGQYEYQQGSAVGLNKRYIGMLTYTLGDCPAVLEDINQLAFKDAAIVRLIQNYNTCANSEAQSDLYTFRVKPVVRHGAELAYSNVLNYEVVGGPGYMIGYFLETYRPDLSKRISARLSINYLYAKGEEVSSLSEPTPSTHALRIPIALQLNLGSSHQAALLPFINIGMSHYVFPFSRSFHMSSALAAGAGLYVHKVRFSGTLEKIVLWDDSPTLLNLSIGLRLDRKSN